MSDEAQQQNIQDRFLGIKSSPLAKDDDIPLGEPKPMEDGGAEFQVEVVDDTPEEDRRAPKQGEVGDDDEAANYSKNVQERINKLKYEYHEERRQKEAAEREKDAALQATQQLWQQNQQMRNMLAQGEESLITQVKQKAELALSQAKAMHAAAVETGETEKIAEASQHMIEAQTELNEIQRRETARKQQTANPQPGQPPEQWQQPGQAAPQQLPPAMPQAQPQQSQRMQSWTQENPWFQASAFPGMTRVAFGKHEELKNRGIALESDQYFQEIDSHMREKFPDYFAVDEEKDDKEETPPAASPPPPAPVVAPVVRSNTGNPRKVQLKASEVKVAKNLGLTPEQYAKQVAKLQES